MEQDKFIGSIARVLDALGFKPDGNLKYLRIFLLFTPLIVTLNLAIYLIMHGNITYDDFTNTVETIFTFLHVSVKYIVLIVNYQRFQLLIVRTKQMFKVDDFDENLNHLYKTEITKIAKTGKTYAILVGIIVSTALLRPIFVNELPVLFYVPKSVPTWVSKTFSSAALLLAAIVIVTFDVLSFTLMSLLMLKMRILNENITNLGIGEDPNEAIVSYRLKQWIKSHIDFYSYFKLLNSIVRWAVLLQVIIFIVSMSFELHLAVTRAGDFTNRFKSFAYILGVLAQLFVIYCRPAFKLTKEATDTLFYYYDTPWCNSSVSIQKSLLVIMIRLQKETVICVGNVIIANLELFTNAFKASYTYFTALQAMQQVYTE